VLFRYIVARAIDSAGTARETAPASISVVSDPGTTVTGSVVFGSGNPVSDATVSCSGVSGVSAADGAFAIASVPTIDGAVRCSASFTGTDGITRRGVSATAEAAAGATTNVGMITITNPNGPAITSLRPTSGSVAGGSTIEIVGTNLGGITSVKFGGVPAPIYVTGSTQLTVAAPAHAAGAVDVVIATAGGADGASVTNGFTYVNNDVIDRDFSAFVNPSPRWTYGWAQSRGAAFVLSTNRERASYGLDYWHGTGTSYHNWTNSLFTGSGTNHLRAGGFAFHPAPGGQNAVARWTAPASGRYRLSGSVWGADFVFPTTTDFAILRNNSTATTLFSTLINSYNVPVPFDVTLTLNIGETIDFTVGFGSNGNWIGDSTAVDAKIEPLP
jgi:hypothetical protein